jgi:hypothetical protein
MCIIGMYLPEHAHTTHAHVGRGSAAVQKIVATAAAASA